ncbi:hypothetical protein [Pseudarthrobacter sulfonivorans]|uniref:hypothetical protein n=1 Tax=Pseudarthrobacter sulfonivorans TaxID=121292 RepID=UPI00285ADDE5|nr:hypothetical protein [Pseudarthrobacter sulfonivorans]MDR6416188.1 hypothetical protein [Pseudarthrobacter sulfonivorans]
MSVREPWRLRKALLAGAVALALTGTAIGWSATDVPSPSPSPTESAPGQSGQSGNAGKPGKADKAQRPQHLHSESVVKKADGTFETRLSQQGTVDSVNGSSVTVKSEDGFTQTYAVNSETKIIKFPPPAADGSPAKGGDGKRLRPAEVAIGEIARGESVRISGVKSGNGVTARQVVEGAPTGPGKGMGMGRGHGHGKGHGHGLGKLKDR